MRTRLAVIGFFCICLGLPRIASAEPPAGTKQIERESKLAERFDAGRKWAVVIGVNDYLDPSIDKLRYCVADASLVATTLVEKCGYEEKRILSIVDDSPSAHLRPLNINLRKQIPL